MNSIMHMTFQLNHSLFFIVPSFIIGIIFSSYWLSTVIIVALLPISIFLLQKRSIGILFLFCQLIYLLGIFTGIAQHKSQHIDPVLFFKQHDLLGTVTNIEEKNGPFRYVFDIASSQLITQNGRHIDFNKTIRCYSNKDPAIFVADTIKISSIIFKPLDNEPFKRYLMKEGIASTIFLKDTSVSLLSRPYLNIKRWVHKTRKTISTSIVKKMNRLTKTLFQLIFLGKQVKTWQTKKIRAACQEWGANHMLARSGLHLLLFIIMWSWLMRLCCIPLVIKNTILLTFIVVLALLSWPSVSFLRSFYTFGWYFLLKIMNQQVHLLHAFFLITFITLLYNPVLIYFLDFQLSFGMTFALALFSHCKFLQRLKMQPTK